MRFGGHETFPIREGWLHKGLYRLVYQPDLLVDEHAADWLGVGRNMAKSIRHWLVATGLAKLVPDPDNPRKKLYEATTLAHLIWRWDPYFLETGTWWALHVNLLHVPKHAYTWSWFLNHFHMARFDRAVCFENLRRAVEMDKGRTPSPRTLKRDLACLLASYSTVIPAEKEDPEDPKDCPFTELGLLAHYRTSGYYQLQYGAKEIPPHILGYCLSKAYQDAREGRGSTDVTIHDAARRPRGPGRAFLLTPEDLFEVATQVESTCPEALEIAGLASERALRIPKKQPLDWLDEYFQRVVAEEGGRHVA